MNETTEQQIISLFSKEPVTDIKVINTSHGDEDFREALIVTFEGGRKSVIKAADNEFTDESSVRMWKRCVEEYTALGYYCPQIFGTLDKSFPRVNYKGHDCILYGEEFSKYETADKFENCIPFRDELYLMTARVAKKRFDYTDRPSAYTLFVPFPGDEIDEVTENALEFKNYCEILPQRFHEQTERMFSRWEQNRSELEKLYSDLPFSVFQADFNDTNVLLNEDGRFVGLCDFNLAGRDEFLNYLFREIFTGSFDEELNEIIRALKIVKKEYSFSDEERKAALLIYRCVKPLWFTRVESLKEAGENKEEIQKILDEMEYAQTRDIDFEGIMK